MNITYSLSLPKDINEAELSRVLGSRSNITHLDLNGCSKITDACIPIIIFLSRLEEVRITGTAMNAFNLEAGFIRCGASVKIIFEDPTQLVRSNAMARIPAVKKE